MGLSKTSIALAMIAGAACMSAPAYAKKPSTPTPSPTPTPTAPTLHGFCSLASVCTDNGTNTPTGVNPPVFGFSSGGHDETGTLFLDILIPNTVALPASFTISGALVGSSTYVASLFNSTAWTSGELDAYLGISASPTNPIGAYLPTTLTYQPSATGFYVFRADLGTQTLPSNGSAGDSDLLQLDLGLAQGSYVLAYLNQDGDYGATANSGAILETGPPPPPALPEPSTWAMMLAGFGATGFAMRRSRRKTKLVSQLA
jgi:PEP-CTERM motif-containing protein